MKIFILFLFPVFLAARVCSQSVNVADYIEAWKASDTSQTHKGTPLYDKLDNEKDTLKFKQILKALYDYVEKHPDKRMEARVLTFDAFGAMVFQSYGDQYARMLERAMQLAHELRDDQLMAEIYAYYAEVTGHNNHMLYNLKAIEIQQRIGFSHFYTVHNRFFIVSNALYHSRDYKQSISYGLRCLSFVGTDQEHWLRRVYILQLDILGAAYKKLGAYDSSIYYYQKILDTLESVPDSKYRQQLWTGIAKGNIGYCRAMQKSDLPSTPLIQEYVQNSIAVEDWINVSIANNLLAAVYYFQKQYASALKSWQEAWFWAVKTNSIDNSLESAKGIADVQRLTGKTDSAFYYYDLYHTYSDTLESRLDQSRLSAMQARIAFDNLQDSLVKSNSALTRSRDIMRVVIAGGILLAIIFLLLYNRHRLKEKHKLQLIQKKNEEAEQEVKNAKAQITQFMSNIVEKNNLIESMEARLAENQPNQASRLTIEDLSHYTLVSEEEWERFKGEFAKAYPAFLTALRKRLSHITPAEERLSMLIYLQLNNYQIANTLGIGKESVSRAKRRLKQRLDLDETDSVDSYMTNLLEYSHQ